MSNSTRSDKQPNGRDKKTTRVVHGKNISTLPTNASAKPRNPTSSSAEHAILPNIPTSTSSPTVPKRRGLVSEKSNMLFLNVQGLLKGKVKRKKMDFVKEIAETEKPLYIVMTESHLDSNIDDSEIAIPNYSVYRSDRKTRVQGGVIVYVRNPYPVDENSIVRFSNDQCDTVAP